MIKITCNKFCVIVSYLFDILGMAEYAEGAVNSLFPTIVQCQLLFMYQSFVMNVIVGKKSL